MSSSASEPGSPRTDKRLARADGEKIVRLRRAMGWSQEVLAERVGIAPRTVERAEAGRLIYIRTIADIAGALHVAAVDLMIASEPFVPLPTVSFPFVFISYSHADSEFANAFSNRLDDAGIPHFRDAKIGWSEDISERVHQALEQATHLVVLLSPASARSQWVPYEMGYAKGRNVVLIPYLLHPSMPLPDFIALRRYLKSIEDEAQFIAMLQEDLKRKREHRR